jgi:putative ABC transport system substrate-binding protein
MPPSSYAAKIATKRIPIVFLTGGDPVKLGLVDSFSRPGGNLTGVSILISVLRPKRLELLREMVPTVSLIALLVNPSNQNVEAEAPETQAAAEAIGLGLEILNASTEGELETVFATMVQKKPLHSS